MVTVRLVGDKGLVISILARGSWSLAPWRGLGIPQILTREFPKHQRWKKGFFPPMLILIFMQHRESGYVVYVCNFRLCV